MYDWGQLVLRDGSITLKELLPVVLACAVWGEQWKLKVVLVHCDNQGVVSVVNSGCYLFFIKARF